MKRLLVRTEDCAAIRVGNSLNSSSELVAFIIKCSVNGSHMYILLLMQ